LGRLDDIATRLEAVEEEVNPQSEGEGMMCFRGGGSKLDLLKGIREDFDSQFEERNRQLENVWSAKVRT